MSKNQRNKTLHNISRRAFVLGGLATFAASGIAIQGCSNSTTSCIDVGVADSVDDFDLMKDAYPLIISAGWHVFEALYSRNANTGDITPAIAKSLPTKVADLSYDIKIDTSKKFNDGENITMEDVCDALLFVKEDAIYKSLFDFVKSGEAINNDTLRLHLKYEVGDLLETRLCLLRIFKTIWDEDDNLQSIYGSGPWVYNEGSGENNTTLTFVPNQYYQGRYPVQDQKMVWHIITDDDDRMKEGLNGKFDVIERVKPSYFADFEKKGYTVKNLQSTCMPLLAFNTLSSPFNDVRVRQALLYAINTNSILSDALLGYGNKATSILPEYHKYYARAKYVYSYNPNKAKQLLEDAGISGFKFDLLNFGEYWGKIVAAEIVADLNTIGVKCHVRESDIDWNDFSNSPDNSDFEVALIRSDPSYFGQDPDMIIEMLWGYGVGDLLTNWSYNNTDKWNELEDLAQKARCAKSEERMTYWSQCYDLISEHVPMYPLLFRSIASAWNPKTIENFTPIPMDGISLLGANLIQ